MILRLHRWQPKTGRFQRQIFNMTESKPVIDLLFKAGVAPAAMRDVSVDQKIFRTQHVDRITVSEFDGAIDIFLSPVVERKYHAVRKGPSKCRTDAQRAVAQEVYKPTSPTSEQPFALISTTDEPVSEHCGCGCVACQLGEHCHGDAGSGQCGVAQ